jgi:hypothetical protein
MQTLFDSFPANLSKSSFDTRLGPPMTREHAASAGMNKSEERDEKKQHIHKKSSTESREAVSMKR